MSAVWILLYLGTLVHHLTLYGYAPARGGGAILLVPVLALAVLPGAARRAPVLLHPLLVRAMGLAGFACALLFVRGVYLDAWDTWRWDVDLLAAAAGLGSLWAMVADGRRPGPAAWLWVAFWGLTGFLDPALPFLGAALAGVLSSSGIWPSTEEPDGDAPASVGPVLPFLLLGLALPKPWWDFGLDPRWAPAFAAFGAGAALAAWPPLSRALSALPKAALAAVIGALAILYWPTLALPWGLLLGLAAGPLWAVLPAGQRWTRPGLAVLGGLLLSFLLHSNLWIPGLRHLIWLGN